jgi:hypothetical protein
MKSNSTFTYVAHAYLFCFEAICDHHLTTASSWLDECNLKSLKNSQVYGFFKLHEKPYYYLVIIYMRKLCSHVRKSQRKLRNFHLFLFFGLYFTFWHCISKKFPLLLANQNWEMFSCIKTHKNISKTRCSHNVVQPRRDIGGIKTEEHEHMQK